MLYVGPGYATTQKTKARLALLGGIILCLAVLLATSHTFKWLDLNSTVGVGPVLPVQYRV